MLRMSYWTIHELARVGDIAGWRAKKEWLTLEPYNDDNLGVHVQAWWDSKTDRITVALCYVQCKAA